MEPKASCALPQSHFSESPVMVCLSILLLFTFWCLSPHSPSPLPPTPFLFETFFFFPFSLVSEKRVAMISVLNMLGLACGLSLRMPQVTLGKGMLSFCGVQGPRPVQWPHSSSSSSRLIEAYLISPAALPIWSL